MNRVYVCIDLKSFYASVECVLRNLDPLTTNLVVADISRTEKTICLAVTPSLKKYGLSGRSRLYEVVQKVKEVNRKRKYVNKNKDFIGKSYDDNELNNKKDLEVDYIIAPPHMHKYMEYSNMIYKIYLKYFSCEDIHVYSIDEVFIDVTNYLHYYEMGPKELVSKVIKDIYINTGITATVGIGTNLYLAKIAMDILAKHVSPNEDGIRIASLNKIAYRKLLWNHKPITDFWRVGSGTSKRLEKYNMFTMGDIARCSIDNEELLYKLFGINAELLIDHAWGDEVCTIKDIKNYRSSSYSMSSGQVLHVPYDYLKAKIIVKEMTELLTLEMLRKGLVTSKITLTIGYDVENLINPYYKNNYQGEVVKDHYGRLIPKHSHGTINIDHLTSSYKVILEKIVELYERIINKNLLVRRINITFCNVLREDEVLEEKKCYQQLNLFEDVLENEKKKQELLVFENKENKVQRVILKIKDKYGKNAILKGINLLDGATTISRNKQVGGHSE